MGTPVITGLGCISALGTGVPVFWHALLEGQTGIKPIRAFGHGGLRTPLAGAIHPFDPRKEFLETETSPTRLLLFAFAAVDEALADAGVDIAALKAAGRRVALVIGTSLGMSLVAPAMVGEHLTDFPGNEDGNADLRTFIEALELRYGLADAVSIVSTACASGTHAIGLARDMILYDEYDLVIAGGADSLDRMKYLGHSALPTLTTGLPRPFARDRDGTLFGEGAGFLVLEKASRAERRRYATCAGSGYSTDIHHLTAPDPEGVGAALAIRAALADAGVEPDAIGHVNLHGSGTALNDTAEAKALSAVFGDRIASVPSTSIKPATGHVMGAAGALEAIATVLALRDGMVPPTLNVQDDDVDLPIDLVTDRSRPLPATNYAISNSFGFGGANGVLVFGR